MKSIKKGIKSVKKAQNAAKNIAKRIEAVEHAVAHPGATLGGAIGGRLGSKKLGQKVGGFIGKIAGVGDYVVSSNTMAQASAKLTMDSVPSFANNSRETRICHREFLGDVVASSVAGAFSLTNYPINPGMFQSFPWLQSIAAQFDQWKPNGIVVVFKSTSSSYSGTAQLGTVIIASDYDVLDPLYTTKVEMENSAFAVSCASAESLIHPLECAVSERMMRVLNTRQGGVPATDNLRWYDLCNTQVATVGCVANQVVGELWISYDISFFKAQLFGGLIGRSILSSAFQATTGIADAELWGTSQTYQTGSAFQVVCSGVTMTFPTSLSGGSFIVTCYWSGSVGATASTPTVNFVSGTSAGPNFNGAFPRLSAAGTTVTTSSFTFSVTLTGSSSTAQTISLTGGAYPDTFTASTCVITQINPALDG